MLNASYINYKLLVGVRSFLFMVDKNVIFYYQNPVIHAMTLSILLSSGRDEMKRLFTSLTMDKR